MKRSVLSGPAAIAALVLCGAATAQPKLVITGLSDDLAGSGTRCVGLVWDLRAEEYVPYRWELGVGYSPVPGAFASFTGVRCSDDLTALTMGVEDVTDWGNLSCFGGYCFGSMTGCVPGQALPPPNPCRLLSMAHRWTANTGWVGTGSFERLLDPATGRFYGGTRCDFDINSPNDISGDGRYVVGGAWYAQLTTLQGGPGFGLCGDFYGFRYDSQTGAFTRLPTQPGTRTTRADRISRDGSVITGYDLGPVPDGAGGTYSGRRICAWTNGVQTLIDTYTDQSATYPVNGAGTVIAGSPGSAFLQANFGVTGIRLVRWVRQGDNTWLPQNLGRPIDRIDEVTILQLTRLFVAGISDDGNTIVGTAQYGNTSRPFIWRPTINRGVPMDLADYIASISPGNPILTPGVDLQAVRGVSNDGNAVLVTTWDARNTCTTPETLSLTTGNAGILYLSGGPAACEPVRMALGPVDTQSTQYTPFGVALNVIASGSWPIEYRWQGEDRNQPGTWVDLSESCANFEYGVNWDYEGVHTRQLRVGEAMCGGGREGRYRVIVSNACGSVTSEPAMVSFSQLPWFYGAPQSTSACANGDATFHVDGRGSGDNVYQWQIADPSVAGGWADVFDGFITREGLPVGSFSGAGSEAGRWEGLFADGGTQRPFGTLTFRCVATNGCGSAVSGSASVSLCLCLPCPADFNLDGGVDGGDVESFFVRWQDGHCDADVNQDGGVDGADVESFFVAWENAGC